MSAIQRKLTLVELKQMIGINDGANCLPKQSFSLFHSGFPKGRLIEISGTGKTEFISTFIKENSEGEEKNRTAWIENKLTVNPFGLWQRGIKLDQILFVETKEVEWATQQILQSQLFKIVVLSQIKFDEKDLRRFQLLTEKSEGYLFVLSEELHKSWVPSLQLEVKKEEGILTTEIIRQRGYS